MSSPQPIRILVIDDQESIHEDFRKILDSEDEAQDLSAAAAALFGDSPAVVETGERFLVDSAHQGQEGLAMIEEARRQQRPYPLAFVDVRMPPGWDGVETSRRIWEIDPEILIVLCTAYSDHTWEDIVRSLGRSDHLLILKKPFDNIEVQQLVLSLTKRWHLARQAELTRSRLEELVAARTAEVEVRSRDLEKAVQELQLTNGQLEQARRAAVEANRAKTEFLANMSHEIRTPMTAIIGYAQLLRDESSPGEISAEHGEYVDAIIRNAGHLLGLLDNILDISRIESGRLTLLKTRCCPFEIVDAVVRQMRVSAESKGVALTWECRAPIPETVLTDPLRLRQILLNLIGNAVKFTDKGTVQLAVALAHENRDRPLLRLQISDTGIGIPEDQIGRLFQRFSQTDGSSTRRFGGSGLGLAISKRLAQLLGGDIDVQSALGQGSTFTVTVETGPLNGIELVDRPPPRATASQEFSSLPGNVASRRILVVEDAPDNQRFLARVLSKAAWEVTVAENGQVACDRVRAAAAEAQPFDLILMDMQMPVLDGYEATRRLRDAGFTAPIVALTANSTVEDQQRCLASGCDRFVTKPVDRQRLLQIAAECIVLRTEPPLKSL